MRQADRIKSLAGQLAESILHVALLKAKLRRAEEKIDVLQKRVVDLTLALERKDEK